ncbi:uncharacterized protein LOC143803833 [Ranitomeya variabilis]|uniref:uncharacterized protein LOC143803833 n=1 Tax=Ranitomeya variabilis TaxID=490064 RepID=UPI004055FF00
MTQRYPSSPGRSRKRPRLDLDQDDDEVLSKEESDGRSSDQEEGELPLEEQDQGRKFLFHVEETEDLVQAVRNTMQMKEEPRPKSRQDLMFGGLTSQRQTVFPVSDHLKQMILQEWKDAERRLIVSREFKSRLPFDPEDIKAWEEIPKIDVPIAKVTKKTAIPFEDSSSLRDAMDRKADILLRRSWETSAALIKANIAATSIIKKVFLRKNRKNSSHFGRDLHLEVPINSSSRIIENSGDPAEVPIEVPILRTEGEETPCLGQALDLGDNDAIGASEVLCKVSGPNLPPSISRSPVRPGVSTEDIYKIGGGSGGILKKRRNYNNSLSGRFSAGSQNKKHLNPTQRSSHCSPKISRLGRESREISHETRISEGIFGSSSRCHHKTILFAKRKTGVNKSINHGIHKAPGHYKISHEGLREDDSLYHLRKVGTGSLKIATGSGSLGMGSTSVITGQSNPPIKGSKKVIALVDTIQQPKSGGSMDLYPVCGDHYGCQPVGLGSPSRRIIRPGQMAKGYQSKIFKLQRALRYLGSSKKESLPLKKTTCENLNGQHDSSILHKTPRRSQIQTTSGIGTENIFLGRKHSPVNHSSPLRRISKRPGRLFEQERSLSHRMGIKPRNLSPIMSSLGDSQDRSIRYKKKFEGGQILFPQPYGHTRSSRRLESNMGRTTILCFSPNSTHSEGPQEDSGRPSNSSDDSTILAKKELVSVVRSHGDGQSSQSSSMEGHDSSRTSVTSKPGTIAPFSMDPERDILKSRGLSDEVISTIQASRKPYKFQHLAHFWIIH